ncbi:phospholipid/cholesterol/gamma-HCH transport system permease protein [Ereboglobus sp. PH5-5]|uniref:MlaE family ABC transporter permease n=1 Tax=Ereboglobus sp. PH5-5 TaxID=2940529 RepID=UPI002405C845|nr:ABC transporter permease [Ereboglobus sp. PH5-5]MDF9834100.1 phospholipid/cholesterol/gamma-HCH transport system permease protein [Ereboglobus sp. PH5-5]
MNRIITIFDWLGGAVIMALRAFRMLPQAPRILKRTFEHVLQGGYASLPIVSILSFFIGAVLALQAGLTLQDFGAKQLIGTLVGEALVRELGPVFVAILVAGRVASATTAELASMRVYQEVDALVTMNIPPERFLVLPRLLAVLGYMPILTMVGIVIGWIGGAVVCKYVGVIGVEPAEYFQSVSAFLTTQKMVDSLLKAEIFGFVIILIACNTGLRTKGGPREIGFAVTNSVVYSLIAILGLDYFITKALGAS